MGRVVDTERILRSLGVSSPSAPVVRWAESTLGVAQFERLCVAAGVTAANADVRKQITEILAAAGIRWEVSEAAASRDIARAGPLVFYGNHPYGFADALLALTIALDRRADTKVLANSVLAAFDFHAAHTIWVDIGAGEDRRINNHRSMRVALRHLSAGGALLIFPSQTCSHLQLPQCRVTDPPWSPHLLTLIERTNATCVPLYFEGCNSWRFQLLGLVHPLLRTMLLLREFVGLRGQCIRVRVGAAARLDGAGTHRGERMRQLRERLYALRGSS